MCTHGLNTDEQLMGLRSRGVVTSCVSSECFLPAVFEEAAHAGAGHRGGEAGHQALLPEERHHQGGVQGDSAQGRSEGGCCLTLSGRHEFTVGLKALFLLMLTYELNTVIASLGLRDPDQNMFLINLTLLFFSD